MGRNAESGEALEHTRLVEHYFAGMNARDVDAVVALFDVDAVLGLPDGREFSGVEAIRGWFTSLFVLQAPSPKPSVVIAAAGGVATEIDVKLPDGRTRRTANFFHVNAAGRIARLTTYARG